jgi:hypothetical protein
MGVLEFAKELGHTIVSPVISSVKTLQQLAGAGTDDGDTEDAGAETDATVSEDIEPDRVEHEQELGLGAQSSEHVTGLSGPEVFEHPSGAGVMEDDSMLLGESVRSSASSALSTAASSVPASADAGTADVAHRQGLRDASAQPGLAEKHDSEGQAVAKEGGEERSLSCIQDRMLPLDADSCLEGRNNIQQGGGQAAEAAADDAEGGPTDRKPVEITLKLALDFSAAGKAGSAQRVAFNNNLTQDLSNASGFAPHLFEVVRVSAGSIIVGTLIHSDPADRGLNPMLVAMDLQKQAHQPNSPLLSGLLTRHCEGIVLPTVPPGSRGAGGGVGAEKRRKDIDGSEANVLADVHTPHTSIADTIAHESRPSTASLHQQLHAAPHNEVVILKNCLMWFGVYTVKVTKH